MTLMLLMMPKRKRFHDVVAEHRSLQLSQQNAFQRAAKAKRILLSRVKSALWQCSAGVT